MPADTLPELRVVPRTPAEVAPLPAAFSYVLVQERPVPPSGSPVPPWFDGWFARTFPDANAVAGYRANVLGARLGAPTDAVYKALYDGSLEGFRATCRGWIVPPEAVRAWLLDGLDDDPAGFASRLNLPAS